MTHHISTEDPAPYGAESEADRQPSCRWCFGDIDGYWATACAHAFVFNDGGPSDNDFRFCPFCGLPLRIADAATDDTDGSREA
jgi:hypothetical protein